MNNETLRDLVARTEAESKQANVGSLWISIPRARWDELVRLAEYGLDICDACGHGQHDQSPWGYSECEWATCTCYVSPCPECGQNTWRSARALGWQEEGAYSNVVWLSVCPVCQHILEGPPIALAVAR
jgi:hypothetical protein